LSCIVGNVLFGLEGFIVGMGMGTLCGQLGVEAAIFRHGINIVRQDASYSLVFVLCASGSALLSNLFHQETSSVQSISVGMVIALVMLLPLIYCLIKRIRRELGWRDA